MKRRFFRHVMALTALLACFASAPGPAVAETVGVIVTRGAGFYEKSYEAFLSQLAEKGYSKKIQMLTQTPYPDPIAWSNAARKLVAVNVDVIVTFGTAPSMSVIKERSGIPLIYSGVYEPIAETISRKDATGVCSRHSISSLLRYLRAAEAIDNIGVIYCGWEDDSLAQYREIKELAGRYGIRISEYNMKQPSEASERLNKMEVSSLLLTSSSVVGSVSGTILRFAHNRRIPTASFTPTGEPFPTIVMSASAEQLGRGAAEKLIDFLNGRPISSIPPTCATDVEIVFNLKEAQALGMKIPMNLVTEATRIIQ